MKLAILHYHLAAGGVTRVIANHLRSLDGDASIEAVLIVSDGNWSGFPDLELSFPVSHVAFDGMTYRESAATSCELADDVQIALVAAGFGQDETVLHAHNHSLGKTTAVASALHELLGRGWAVLYQIHDFAEDFRPDGYVRMQEAFGDRFGEVVYPQRPRAHYATLTVSDHDLLAAAGVTADRNHRLPNPVLSDGTVADSEARTAARQRMVEQLNIRASDSYWVYPVRGIRRKNLGEACLIAAAMQPESVVIGVTLSPENPKEQPQHQAWTEFARSAGLPIRFGTGDPGQLSFAENLAAADAIVTTSISEGFGMVFLEAWLNQRPLVGRDLPDITADFKRAGLDLSMLTAARPVPIDWFDHDGLIDRYRSAFRDLQERYRQPPIADDDFERQFVKPIVQAGEIDFGRLDETAQQQVIRTVLDDPKAASTVREQVTIVDDHVLIQRNATVVHRVFGKEASGRRLLAVYRSVLESPTEGDPSPIDAGSILTNPACGKLSLGKFRLLRT